jgi:hypothetical protein
MFYWMTGRLRSILHKVPAPLFSCFWVPFTTVYINTNNPCLFNWSFSRIIHIHVKIVIYPGELWQTQYNFLNDNPDTFYQVHNYLARIKYFFVSLSKTTAWNIFYK